MYKKNFEEKISVIIPTYNRYGYLKQLINSIFEQSYNNIELINEDVLKLDLNKLIKQEKEQNLFLSSSYYIPPFFHSNFLIILDIFYTRFAFMSRNSFSLLSTTIIEISLFL